MSIKVTYRDGVFEPIEDVTGVRPDQYTVFSDEELAEIHVTIGLSAADKSLEFWDNPADPVYDNL